MRSFWFYIIFFFFSLFSSCLMVGEEEVVYASESLEKVDYSASAGSLQATDTENPLWLFCEGDFSSSSCVYAPHAQLNGGARTSGGGKNFSWAARFCSSLANLRQLFCRRNSSILKSFCRADGYYIYMLRKIIIWICLLINVVFMDSNTHGQLFYCPICQGDKSYHNV